MSNEYKIIGGTAGYNKMNSANENTSTRKRLYMFHPDAKISSVFISKKTRLEGTILPAFDSAMDKTDTAYKSGYSQYRVPNMTDPETGCPYFSDWFVTLSGYNYYGNGKMNFFSPKSVGCPDPIQEIRDYCWKRHNAGDFSVDSLINRPEKFGDPYALPKLTPLTLLNVVCPATYDKDPVQGEANRILILKSAATDKLFADLNTATPAGMENTSGDTWADVFCYGDITNPSSAIKFTTTQDRLDNGMEYSCLNLGKVVLNGRSRVLNCKRTVIAPEFLEGRFDLTDLSNIIYIPSYQEIVDMLIQDELIPFDIIETVCGEKAHVRRSEGATPGGTYDEYSYEEEAPAPAPAPAPAANKAEMVYVTINGATERMSTDDINAMQDPDLQVYDGAAWKPAAMFPWYKIASAPMPAPAPAPMPAPAPAPAPAVPPAAIMPPAADGRPRRTKEQEDRLAELNRKLIDDVQLGVSEINEMSQLSRMLPYVG